MTRQQTIFVVGYMVGTLLLSGCGDKKADKERTRLDLEEQARRETETGNKAITDLDIK